MFFGNTFFEMQAYCTRLYANNGENRYQQRSAPSIIQSFRQNESTQQIIKTRTFIINSMMDGVKPTKSLIHPMC